MRVTGNDVIDAYAQHKPSKVSKLEEDSGQDRTNAKPQSAEHAGFNANDFFTLSPTAQRYVTESMLMTAIGEKVGADFADFGIKLDEQVGLDQSPDAVAGRIVSFATSMFSVFESQNPDMDAEGLLTKFEGTVREAVDQGYEQAAGILNSMENISDEIKSIGQHTMELVHEMLDAYFAEHRQTWDSPGISGPTQPVEAS